MKDAIIVRNMGKQKQKTQKKLDSNSLKYLAIILAILIIPQLIFLCLVFPGFLQPDNQALLGRFIAGQPSEATSLLWQLVALPLLYFSPTIFFYGLFQLAVFVFAVTFSIIKLRKLEIVNKIGGIILALVFALCPTFLYYNTLYTPDMIYAILLLPLTVQFVEVVYTKGKFFEDKTNLILMATFIFLLFQMRRNAIILLIMAFIVLLIIYKTYRKKILIMFASVIVAIGVFSGISKFVVHASPGLSREMLSVPVQQIARTYSDGGYIPPKAKAYFESIRSEQEWKDKYIPYTADPEKHGLTFTPKLIYYWIITGFYNVGNYTQAYFDLQAPFLIISNKAEFRNLSSDFDWTLQTEFTHNGCLGKCKQEYLDQLRDEYSPNQNIIMNYPQEVILRNKIPIVSDLISLIFFNSALPFWIIMISFIIMATRKRLKEWLIITIPLCTTMLSLLVAAPVGLMRYAVQMFYVLPVIILLLIKMKKTKPTKEY